MRGLSIGKLSVEESDLDKLIKKYEKRRIPLVKEARKELKLEKLRPYAVILLGEISAIDEILSDLYDMKGEKYEPF